MFPEHSARDGGGGGGGGVERGGRAVAVGKVRGIW